MKVVLIFERIIHGQDSFISKTIHHLKCDFYLVGLLDIFYNYKCYCAKQLILVETYEQTRIALYPQYL